MLLWELYASIILLCFPMFPGNFRDQFETFPGTSWGISRTFPGSFWYISGKVPGNVQDASRTFPGSFRDMPRKLPGNLHECSQTISLGFLFRCVYIYIYICIHIHCRRAKQTFFRKLRYVGRKAIPSVEHYRTLLALRRAPQDQ